MSLPYIVFGLIIIVYELRRHKNHTLFDFMTAINISYIFFYCLVPIGLQVFYIPDYYEDWALPAILKKYYFFNPNEWNAYILIGLSYIFTLLGYSLTQNVHFKFGNLGGKRYDNCNISLMKMFRIAIIFSLLGIFGICIFVFSAGGFINAVANAEYYRSGDIANDGALLIMRIFQPFILSGFFIFESISEEDIKKSLSYHSRKVIKIFKIITFIFCIYYLLISSSRGKIVIFLACMLFINKNRIKLKQVVFLGVVVIFLYIYGDSLLSGNRLEMQSLELSIVKILEQSAYRYIDICNVDKIFEVIDHYRLFLDSIIVWIVNIIPTFILGIFKINKFHNLFFYNSALMNSSSNIPVDYVSYGYWQLGYLGVVINSFLFGIFLMRIEHLLKSKNKFVYILYIRISFALIGVLANFEPENIIRGNLDIIVLVIIYMHYAEKQKYYVNRKETVNLGV